MVAWLPWRQALWGGFGAFWEGGCGPVGVQREGAGAGASDAYTVLGTHTGDHPAALQLGTLDSALTLPWGTDSPQVRPRSQG